MKGKRLTALFTCAFLLTTSTLSYAWADSDSSGKAGEQGTAASGYIESDLDQDTPLYYSGIALYSDIPASYPDGGVDAIRQRYPENRNQNPYGTCWAFASTGLAEFDLINDGLASKDTVDFSELQLAYFTYNFVTDPLGGTEGDVARYYNDNVTYSYLNRGGNFEYSLRRLSQWIGVADESKLKDTVLSAEQKKLVDDGGKADITLTMSDISKNVSDEQKELINSVLKSDDKVGMYVDISVLLTITNAEGNVITDKALVSETATKFTVKMKLADELLQKDSSKIRTYQVVRLHDGKSEILDSEWDASTGTLSFETDKFSTYAISYSDKDKEAVKEPTKDPVKNPTKDFDTDIKDGNKIDNSKPQVNSNVKTDSKQQTKDAIKTGDDNRVLFMFIVFIIAVAGVCVTVNRIVKKN